MPSCRGTFGSGSTVVGTAEPGRPYAFVASAGLTHARRHVRDAAMSAPETSPSRRTATRVVRVECLSCGRAAVLDESRVLDAPLVQLTRHLRCSACGSRAVRAARIDVAREVEMPRDIARLLRARMDTDRT